MYSWNALKDEINNIETTGFVLAISGGVDSMLLMDFFRRQCSYPFCVAHFDHHIRDDSDKDRELISDYCFKNSIPFFVGHGEGLKDIPNQECVARNQRWSFLNKVAIDNVYKYIVTAHHLNDQIENVILRLLRGYPHSCLTMKKFMEVDGIIRYKPFLYVSKDDIIKSAKRMRISWNEDSTNADVDYDRNWIRNEIIPMLMTRRNIISSMEKGIKLTDLI